MLLYWHKESDGICTYSVDMLRYDFTVSESNLNILIRWLESAIRVDVESFGLSTSPFKYRHLFRINYKYSSMVIGLGFNGITKEDAFKCFVELNPNKVFQSQEAFGDLSYLVDCSRRFKLKRFDLAIDIPVARDLVQLVKDQRKYGLTMRSASDKTEYLGTRNEGGFVKLYNKTVESKLDKDVTRLELTCDGHMKIDEIISCFPRLLFLPVQNELLFDDKLSEKDRLLVDLLKLHPDMISRLDYRNRKKFEKYVFSQENEYRVDVSCIRKLLPHIYAFTK